MSSYDITTENYRGAQTRSIRKVVARDEIGATIGTGIDQVAAALARAGVATAGPPYARYHHKDESTYDVEVGFAVANDAVVEGLDATTLPAGRVAVTTHRGHYSGLADAFIALSAWISDHASHGGAPWELYWTNPGELAVEDWSTDVMWPIDG